MSWIDKQPIDRCTFCVCHSLRHPRPPLNGPLISATATARRTLSKKPDGTFKKEERSARAYVQRRWVSQKNRTEEAEEERMIGHR